MTPAPPARAQYGAAVGVVTGMAGAEWADKLAAGCELHWRADHVLLAQGPRLGLRARFTTTDPREAWEALCAAGLIPADWVESAERHFHAAFCTCLAARLGGCRLCHDGRIYLAHPPTIEACVAFAADVPNVLAAEAIARAYGARHWPLHRFRIGWWLRPAWGRDPACAEANGPRDLAPYGYELDQVAHDYLVLAAPPLAPDGGTP